MARIAPDEFLSLGLRSWDQSSTGSIGGSPTTTGTTPSTEAQSLVSTPAQVNLAAGPDLEALSQMVNRINQQANMARVPGGQALEEQSSRNIAEELAGNLPRSFIENLQSGLAQRGQAGGFGVDTAALNAAAMRSMGLETIARQAQGQRDLTAAYERAAPLYDISRSMLTPELYNQYLANKADQAARAASLAEQRRQFDISSEQASANAALESQTRLREAQIRAATAASELAERQREYNITRDTGVLQQIAQLTEQARQANMEVDLRRNQLNTQVYQTNLQYMDPAYSMMTAQTMTQLPNYVNMSIPQYNFSTNMNIPLLGGWS